jgi:dCTP deaminase
VGVIGGQELYNRIFSEEDDSKRLVVTPLLNAEDQIQKGSTSIDVRLGTQFIVQRRASVEYLDPGYSEHPSRDILEQHLFVPIGKFLVLHPNQFALGGTLEYFKMPLDLTGYLVGRSTWGRLGLIVATAIGIHPGYKGIITLELRNIGEVPFRLRPGLTIAQIFLHKVEGEIEKSGVQSHYIGAVAPESSYVRIDRDHKLIDRIGQRYPAQPT